MDLETRLDGPKPVQLTFQERVKLINTLASNAKIIIRGRPMRNNRALYTQTKEEMKEVMDMLHLSHLCEQNNTLCLLYTSPSPRDISGSRMPSSA